MGLLGWLKGQSNNGNRRLTDWRRAWTETAAAPEASRLATLASELDAFGLPDDDVEIEREMLEALRDLLRLRSAVDSSGLPVVETGHRVIGSDRCHFSAPASMPDDPAQPAGRLLLTGVRAVFVGGARTVTLPWHAVGEVVQSERDIVLIRKGRDHLHRFRCNTFTEAMCGTFLAQRLAARRPPAGEIGTASAATPL